MVDVETIRNTFERSAQIVARRPSVGQKTYVTKVRVHDGLTCDIEEGAWKMTADLAIKNGGNALGPTPGMFGRAALGSCLAMSYVMWAAKLGVALDDVEVEVHAETDLRGMYGVGDVAAGYTDVRFTVFIDSPAPEADVLRVLDIAEAHSPYVDVFTRGRTLKRDVRFGVREEEVV